MKCPNCNETLLMSERNGIEIDYCPSCRGIWLDKGELDKMLEYADRNIPTQEGYRPERHEGDYKGDKHYKQHKKRSFLGDLFDFD